MTSPQNPWNRPDAYGGQQQNPWGQPGGQYPMSGGFAQPAGHPGGTGYPVGGGQPPLPGGAERPRTVEAAFWVSVVIPLLTTVLAVVGYLLLLDFVGNLFDANAPESSSAVQPDQVMGQIRMFMLVTFIFLTVVYLVLTALWILFGFKMRAGRNWARVVLAVLAGLWVLSTAGSLPTAGGMNAFSSTDLPGGVEPPGGLIALGYAQAAVGLAGMIAFAVLAFAGPSNRYFRVMSGQVPAAAPGYPVGGGYPGPGR